MADLDFTASIERSRPRAVPADPLAPAPLEAVPEPTSFGPPAAPKAPAAEFDFSSSIRKSADLAQRDGDLRAGMAAYRATQSDLTPEKAVEIAQLAHARGKPVQFVADNLDELRRTTDAEKLKAAILESPVLQEMLLDPSKAGVLKDQIADANTWEWWFGRWDLKPQSISGPDGKPLIQFPMPSLEVGPAWARAGVAGGREQQITYLANKQLLGVTSSEEDKELEGLEKQYGNRDFGANNPFTKGVVGGVKMAPYMLGAAVARLGGGAAAAATGAGPVGFMVGQYAGGAAWDFYQNVGPLYRQLRSMKRGDGTPLLTDEEAKGYAVPISAGISAATSGLGTVALKGFPLTRELLQKATRKGVEKAFVEVGGEQAVRSFMTRWGTHVGAGGAMMAVQGGGNAAAAELAKGQHGEEWSVLPVIDAAKSAFLTGIQDMSLIAMWGPGREYLRERGLRTVVDAEAAKYQGIVDQAQSSTILERLKDHPDQAAQILGKLSLGQSVLADPVAWDAYWTSKKFNPRDVAAEVVGDGGKLYDMARSGVAPDLQLPLDRYLARFGKTEHMAGLQPDVKMTPDGLTPRQMEIREKLAAQLDAAELPPAEQDVFTEQLDGFERAAMAELLGGTNPRSRLEAESIVATLKASITAMALKEGWEPAHVLQTWPLTFETVGTKRPAAPAPAAREAPPAPATPVESAPAPRASVVAALRGDRAALSELARPDLVADRAVEAENVGRAWSLLKKGEAAPGLEDLVQTAREAAVARGEGAIPKAIRANIERVDSQIRKVELQKQKEVAEQSGGKKLNAKDKALLAAKLKDPLRAPSSTRPERIAVGRDAEGLAFTVPHPRSEAAPEGARLMDVRLPSWLPAEAYLADRFGWDWTFAAAGGPDAPEHVQKLVHAFMQQAHEGFPFNEWAAKQGWTVARLAAGKGGKKFASLRQRLAEWAAEPEGARAEDPIPEKVWGALIDTARKDTVYVSAGRFQNKTRPDALAGWLSATKAELDPNRPTYEERPPAWYGKPEEGAAHPLDAKLEELRAQRATLEAEGRTAAVAGATPRIRLDRDAVAAAVGAEVDTVFRNLTEPGGMAPDELAKRLGWPSGDAMLAAMARAARKDGATAIAALDEGVVVLGQASRRVVHGRVQMSPDRMVGLVQSSADVMRSLPAGTHGPSVTRDAVQKHLEGTLQGEVVPNRDTGWDIGIGARGIRESTLHTDRPSLLAALHMGELLRVAVRGSTHEDAKETKSILAIHALYAGFAEGGREFRVKMRVREHALGKRDSELRQYSLEAVELERLGPAPAAGGSVSRRVADPARAGNTEPTISVSRLFADVKDHPDSPEFSGEKPITLGQPREIPPVRASGDAISGMATALRAAHPDIQDRRGEIQFVPPDAAGKPVAFNARILEGADESTAAHEVGHWLGLVLGQIAGDPGSAAEHQALYRTALDYMGYKDHVERLAALAEQGALVAKVQADRATDAEKARLRVLEGKEEKLSFAFEQVLAEGKAPSPELAPVFARYKLWLSRIYKGIENLEARYEKDYGEKLNLSPEVREMFKRLLASEDQIAQAEREYDAAAFRAVLKEIDPDSAEDVEKAAAARRELAEARLYQVLTEESRREQTQFFAGERERLRADVEAELDAQPVYQALRWLRDGTMPEGRPAPLELRDEGGQARLFDRAELIERYGAEYVRTLPPGLTTRDPARSAPADIIAEGFGFKSGDELVRTLQKTPSRAEVVEGQIQDRLEALYPTLKNNPEKLAEAAVDLQHTPERVAEIMQGVRILTRKLLPEMAAATKAIDLERVRDTAARLVGERSIAEAAPGRAAQAERKAAKETLDLLKRATREPNEANRKELAAAAWDSYQVQLLNHYVYLEAKRVREDGETLRGKVQRLSGDRNMAVLAKAGDQYIDRAKEVLGAVEFGASASMAGVHRRAEYLAAAKGDAQAAGAMVAWLERERALNRDPYVPQAVIDMLGRSTHWKDLRLEQLQDVHDAVASISHVAHTKDRVKTRNGEVEKTKAIEEMGARLRDTYGTEKVIVDKNTLAWKRRALRALERAKAGIIRPEELFREMDGGDPNGPFTRLLWRPVSESADAWNDIANRMARPILEEIAKLTKADVRRWRDHRFTVKGQSYSLEAAIGVMLNSGNDSNRNKLEKGWSGAWVDKYAIERWDTSTRMEYVKQLTERDVDLVQRIWDALESVWPEAEALEKRLNGLTPPKIARKPFTLWFNPDGSHAEPNAAGAHSKEFAGGYYPIVFDKRFSSAGARQDEKTMAGGNFQLFQPGVERAITPHGYLNKRIEDFARPVELSLSGLFRHLPQASKDIGMREALIDAHDMVSDSRFRAEILKTIGEPALDFLDKWVQDAANDLVVKDGGAGFWLAAMNQTRRGVTGAVFGLNAAQALQNLTGVVNALTRVDAGFMQKGISKVLSERTAAIDQMNELSPYMKSRSVTLDRDLALNVQQSLGKIGTLHRANEIGMWAFQASDRVVASATWWGAYEQAKAGKVEGVVEGDQAGAVAWADSAVRLSLMSGRTIDLAAVQRHVAAKWFTMFYGWASSQINQLMGAGADAKVLWSDGQKLKAMRRLTRVFFWVLAGAVVSDLATGKGPTDDDEDGKVDGKDWSRWMVRRASMQPLSGIPVLGQVARAAIDNRKNVSLSPTERVFSAAAQTASSAWKVKEKWAEDDDWQEELRAFAGHAAETAAIVGGLPVGQAKSTLGYWMDEERDRTSPVGADVLGSIYGKRRKGSLLGAVYEE